MFKVTKASRKMFCIISASLMALSCLLIISGAAWASFSSNPSANTNLPWEEAIDVLVTSLTGKVAMGISFIAVVAAGAALIFGGDMTGFMRTAVYIVLVIGLIVSAGNIFTAFFSSQSALLPFI